MRCTVGMPSALGEGMSNPVEQSEKDPGANICRGKIGAACAGEGPGDVQKRPGRLGASVAKRVREREVEPTSEQRGCVGTTTVSDKIRCGINSHNLLSLCISPLRLAMYVCISSLAHPH